MPGPGQDLYAALWSIIREPVFEGLPLGVLFEFNRVRRATWAQYNNPEVDDESVASFLERRLGTPIVGNNIVSAVLHGVYAGDIHQLSARSLMAKFWYCEAVHGSLTRATLEELKTRSMVMPSKDLMLEQELYPRISQPMKNAIVGASVYTFKQGIETLSKALEDSLRANRNVELKTGQKVKGLWLDPESGTISVSLPILLDANLTI